MIVYCRAPRPLPLDSFLRPVRNPGTVREDLPEMDLPIEILRRAVPRRQDETRPMLRWGVCGVHFPFTPYQPTRNSSSNKWLHARNSCDSIRNSLQKRQNDSPIGLSVFGVNLGSLGCSVFGYDWIWLIDWLIDRLFVRLIDCLIDWLCDWLTDWSIDWLILFLILNLFDFLAIFIVLFSGVEKSSKIKSWRGRCRRTRPGRDQASRSQSRRQWRFPVVFWESYECQWRTGHYELLRHSTSGLDQSGYGQAVEVYCRMAVHHVHRSEGYPSCATHGRPSFVDRLGENAEFDASKESHFTKNVSLRWGESCFL